jgi:hypothetical protein
MTITFTPAASVSVAPTIFGGQFEMPPADATNPDTTLLLSGGCHAWVVFAAAGEVGPGRPGVFELTQGHPVVLTNNAAVLSAAGNVRVREDTGGASTATVCTVTSHAPGATLKVTRGTAVATQTF